MKKRLCYLVWLFLGICVLVGCRDKTVDNNDCVDLSDDFAIDIVHNGFYTLNIDFQENQEVPYKDVFNYYSCAECYTSDKQGISFKTIQYYDLETMTFAIPYEIVDSYLANCFNTVPDRFSIEFYDREQEKYVFKSPIMESFYSYTVTHKESLGDNKFAFTVEVKNVLTDDIPIKYHNYVVQLEDYSYKILSRSVTLESDK